MPDAADLPDDRWTWEAAATRDDLAGQLDATRIANLFSLFRQRPVSSVAEITPVIAANDMASNAFPIKLGAARHRQMEP